MIQCRANLLHMRIFTAKAQAAKEVITANVIGQLEAGGAESTTARQPIVAARVSGVASTDLILSRKPRELRVATR
jgi:hypothetical protein